MLPISLTNRHPTANLLEMMRRIDLIPTEKAQHHCQSEYLREMRSELLMELLSAFFTDRKQYAWTRTNPVHLSPC